MPNCIDTQMWIVHSLGSRASSVCILAGQENSNVTPWKLIFFQGKTHISCGKDKHHKECTKPKPQACFQDTTPQKHCKCKCIRLYPPVVQRNSKSLLDFSNLKLVVCQILIPITRLSRLPSLCLGGLTTPTPQKNIQRFQPRFFSAVSFRWAMDPNALLDQATSGRWNQQLGVFFWQNGMIIVGSRRRFS